MFKDIFYGSLITFAALGAFSSDANSEQSPEPIQPGQATLTVPANATIVVVESTFNGCDPIYDKASNTVYVPRCMSPSEQQGPSPTMPERILNNTINNGAREVESSIQNGIDRKIFEIGNKIDEALGTY